MKNSILTIVAMVATLTVSAQDIDTLYRPSAASQQSKQASLCTTFTSVNLPTMGWSSWNTYRVNINEDLIKKQADACIATGLKDVGYTYINTDDGFFGGRDAKTGHLLIHPTRFPHGLKSMVDYIHSLGLKAGIYSDAGANTCGCWYDNDSIAQGVGFYGHDQQDAEMYFNEYGYDFIKIDFCGGNPTGNSRHLDLDPRERYTAIANAIKATGRTDVRMNVCRWDYPGTWVKDIATSWRMSRDISCKWSVVRTIIEQNLYLSAYAGGGHYNDMDMLEVGRGLTETEDKTHFGMWCMMTSPLLIGCDLTKIKPVTLEMLKNTELIAINQDSLGLQAYVVKHDINDDTYVLVKDLTSPQPSPKGRKSQCTQESLRRAVALYNPTDTMKTISIDFSELELAGKITIHDVFTHQDVKTLKNSHLGGWEAQVPAHGVAIYTVTGTERLERTRYEAETAFLSAYQELYDNKAVGTATYTKDAACSGGMKVTNLGYRPDNDIQWQNVYSKDGGQYDITIKSLNFGKKAQMFLSVNDEDTSTGSTKVAYQIKPEDCTEGSITKTITLHKGINHIRLSNSKGAMPEIDYMELNKISFK